ncbi:MAG: KpsF/GutQ family sugar-phosphate isomerase [Chitinophagaceae bacterium]|nr:KpsF/GutQ family sugar-phosphate isomerase [Chitinophagaceae bacterium]
MQHISIREIAKQTLSIEAGSIMELREFIDDSFVEIVHLLDNMKGRLVVSGIGKSAIIGQKIVATLNSTGTPSIFMHAADAIHGDLGMVQQDDIVMIISKSGESPEIKVLITLIKNLGNKLIAMVGNLNATLAQGADLVLNTTVSQEACPNNLAPTSSTTAQLAMGDALAVCLMEVKGFSSSDFAKFHPGGSLGKKLYLRVSDLSKLNERPAVNQNSSIKDVIVEITRKRLGLTAVLDEEGMLTGVITDGDLRRMLEKGNDILHTTAKDIMGVHPKTIEGDALAVDALDRMRKNNITQLIVTEDKQYAGVIHLHDLIREGII